MTEPYVLSWTTIPHFPSSPKTADRQGMRVVVAGSQGGRAGGVRAGAPSCVILDIFLPDGSGVDLIKPMRAVSHTVPIIMVSGQSEVDEVVRR